MRRQAILIVLSAIAASGAWPSHGADLSIQAFEGFFSICLKDGPDFLKMSENAHQQKWEQLAEVGFVELAPLANPDTVRVWIATMAGRDLPAGTLIGWTTAKMEGRSVETCTLALPDIDPSAFEKHLFARLDAEKISEERNSAQVTRLYVVFVAGRKQFLKLTVPARTATAAPLVVASSIVER